MPKIIILLHNNTHPHMENLTKETVGWEIMNHSPYSSDLIILWFSSVWANEGMDHLGQKFQTDDELKHCVLNWLIMIKHFMLLVSVTSLDYGKNVIV
jgi:hypothetical protein